MKNSKQNGGELSNFGCVWGKQVRVISVVGCENSQRDEVRGTKRTVHVVRQLLRVI